MAAPLPARFAVWLGCILGHSVYIAQIVFSLSACLQGPCFHWCCKGSMCRKEPTFSQRPSDVYLIRLGMGWSHIFPLLSTFEGPHKASLEYQAVLGETFGEFGAWLPTFGSFSMHHQLPSQLMLQNKKLFRFCL